jgi:OOP family OmpA-OmpF porin
VAEADVLFDFDQHDIRPDADASLRAILDDLNNTVPDGPLLVEGHTDNIGSRDYNIGLSERRAQSVADWLIANGVDTDRITTVGRGLDFPVAPNDTEEGRQLNRRVVISGAT